jgi:hypothetical protein
MHALDSELGNRKMLSVSRVRIIRQEKVQVEQWGAERRLRLPYQGRHNSVDSLKNSVYFFEEETQYTQPHAHVHI